MAIDPYSRIRRNRNLMLFYLLVVGLLIVFVLRRGGHLAALPSFLIAREAATSFLLFCFAIATMTMAFVQICRILIPVRGWFHGRAMFLWLSSAIELPDPDRQGEDHAYSVEVVSAWRKLVQMVDRPVPEKALRQFRQQSSYGGLKATYLGRIFGRGYPLIYDLPLEQLAAQLMLTAELVLDKPRDFSDLLLCVVGIEGARELLVVYTQPNDQSLGADNENERARLALEDAQARGTLARMIQRRTDTFQIETGGRWRGNLRLAVTTCNLVFACLVVLSSIGRDASLIKWLSYLAYAILAGLLAAFMSMLMRDVAAVIENRRKQL